MSKNEKAPEFATVDLSGAIVDSSRFAGHLSALLFVSPNCASCGTTLDELRALLKKANGNVTVICRGGSEECARLSQYHSLGSRIVADTDDRISGMYRISSVPVAVMLNEENRIVSYGFPHREELEAVFDVPTPRGN